MLISLLATVGYDTPERVADVFGHSNAVPLPGVGGIRQGAMGGLATLQQALGARGIQLQPTEESESHEPENRNQENATGLSRQEVSRLWTSGPSSLGLMNDLSRPSPSS
jgi:hypothetical protein